jgi:hypothetical protein
MKKSLLVLFVMALAIAGCVVEPGGGYRDHGWNGNGHADHGDWNNR